LPLWVKVVQTRTDKPQAATDESKADNPSAKEWRRDPNWVIAIFTIALAVIAAIQAGLFIWQLRLLKKSLIDTKISADAAKAAAIAATKSVEIATNSERAWINTDVTFASDMPDVSAKDGPVKSVMVISIENVGSSHAELIRTRIISAAVPSALGIPDSPTYGDDEFFDVHALPGEIIAPNEKRLVMSPLQHKLNDVEKAEIMAGTTVLYCWGLIEYKDISGETKITQFGYSFYVRQAPTDNQPEAMYRLNNRAYNYTT
jgi:hypothetical protein